jgi:hypothetical protein
VPTRRGATRGQDGDLRLLRPAEGCDVDALARPLRVYYRIECKSVVDVQAAIQQIGAIYVSARAHDGWDRVPGVDPAPPSHADLPLIPPTQSRKSGGATRSHSSATTSAASSPRTPGANAGARVAMPAFVRRLGGLRHRRAGLRAGRAAGTGAPSASS